MFCTRCIRVSAIRQRLPLLRQFHTPTPLRSSTEPILTSLEKDASESNSKRPLSMCPEGTVLTGINYIKGGQDPVAKKDEDYPEWLWGCLEAIKKTKTVVEDDLDEFCTYHPVIFTQINIARPPPFFPLVQRKEKS